MNSLYGNFRQLKLSDVWSASSDFVTDYKNSGLAPANNKITDASAESLFYLLYARYGNNVVASSDINQFKYQVYDIIFEYGPTWEKRIDLQNKLRTLTDTDLEEGTKQIYNKALNPSTAPTTEELSYISEQTTAKMKRGKLDKYSQLYEILRSDVTSLFLSKFQKLFLQIVQPELPLWYKTQEDE